MGLVAAPWGPRGVAVSLDGDRVVRSDERVVGVDRAGLCVREQDGRDVSCGRCGAVGRWAAFEPNGRCLAWR